MELGGQLKQIIEDLSLVSVETSMMLGSILVLVIGLISKKSSLVKGAYLLTLLIAFIFLRGSSGIGLILSESLDILSISHSFNGLFLLTLLLILIFPRKDHSSEFYFFLLAMGAGASFMMKANSILIIYLSIELVSFVTYILTGFSFKKKGNEAAIKYLLFGALSSAILLFGLALVYGSTGTFAISEWDASLFGSIVSQAGLFLITLGLFFKVSVFPMHIWVPATYQEAPADAVVAFSIIPKLSGIVLLQRIFAQSDVASTPWIYQSVLFLGMATILVGTLGALNQNNARRMISFGAVAHSGFLLPFAFIFNSTSDDAFWWYAVVYSLMNIGVFYLIDQYERKGIELHADYIRAKKEVVIGVTFTVVLVSLVGLPPFAGFTAKLFLFSTLWESYIVSDNGLLLTYLIVSVLATVAALFFYLRIPYQLFLSKDETSTSIEFKTSTKFIATIFAIGLLLLFFVPKLVVMIHQLFNNVHE